MVATAGAEEPQATNTVTSRGTESTKVPVAVNCCVPLIAGMAGYAGVMAIEISPTVKRALPVTEPVAAWIMVPP